MKNKIDLKKHLKLIFIVIVSIVIIFLILNIYEYNNYTKNYNNKLNSIIIRIREKYPKISEDELVSILNSKNINDDILLKYGIDKDKYSIILENDNLFHKYIIINCIVLILSILIIILIFVLYDKKKDNKINDIIRYIKEINNGNYSLELDTLSEDELSILKNELYKITIKLKENSINSLNDKINLKKSLEDISHQIKTPITSILIMLDILIDNNIDYNKSQEFIKDIKKNILNINLLIQEILKLSKFDANAIKFVNKNYYIYKMINKAVENVSILCDLKNIDIVVEGNKNIKINCDMMWQVEALTNIIKNSIEHANDNSKIYIMYDENNLYTSVIIRNYGSTINKKDMKHIFERFYKGKNAKSDSIGIGLALSKTIIENNNGKIIVNSKNNVTEFIIKYFNRS